MKLFKSKKGYNDVTIIAGILCIFVVTGIFLPYINEGFDQDVTTYNIEGIQDDIGQEAESVSKVGTFDIVISVVNMFYYSWGAMPFWLEAIFFILRIVLILTIARNIWIGGGG